MAALRNKVVNEDLARIHRALHNREKLAGGEILVTGCAGFLGFYIVSFLVAHAKELGIRKVIGLDTLILGEPGWLRPLGSAFPGILDVRKFDIAKDDVAAVPRAADADFVIHMASIASPTFYR